MSDINREAVSSGLAGLGPAARLAFTASCAERRAPALHGFIGNSHPAETALFDAALDALWQAADGGAPPPAGYRDEVGEVLDPIMEEQGAGFWCEVEYAFLCVVHGLGVAAGEPDEVFECAEGMDDSASYVDNVVAEASPSFREAETELQVADIALLRRLDVVPRELADTLRARSRREGERVYEAVRQALNVGSPEGW